MERKLALEPLGWPDHDPKTWRLMAQVAAQLVGAGLLAGVESFPGAPDDGRILDSVASCRCAEALFHFVDAAPDGWISEADRRTVSTLTARADELDPDAFLRSTRRELNFGPGRRRPIATAVLVALKARLALRDADRYRVPAELVEELVNFAEDTANLVSRKGGFNQLHPTVIFHVARALWLAEYTFAEADQIANARERLIDIVRPLTEHLVARVTLGQRSPGEAVALAFCAASAPLVGIQEPAYVLTALEAAAGVQSHEGIWSEGTSATPTRDPDHSAELAVSTHEVGWVLGESLLEMLRGTSLVRAQVPSRLLEAVVRSAAYANASSVEANGRTGWTTVHRYGEKRIELLPTAMVLSLVVSLRRLRDTSEHGAALDSFDVEDPANEFWPDWLKWDEYRSASEPDARVRILDYIHREIVTEALASTKEPPWRRVTACSTLLFGPPGTTKTTTVRAVAQGVGWPLVTLSPGDFIERGLEMVEAQASSVFDRLHALSRVVVLFDECDELFRERHPEGLTDQTRGIAAFITASMLPKLQDLHDRGQILLFVVTNHFQTMDPAVKRLGRMDHIIGVGPPDETQRLRTIESQVDLSDALVRRAAEFLARRCERFNRGEVVRAAQGLKPRARDGGFENEREAIDWAEKEFDRLKVSRVITEADMESFEQQAEQHSGPHIQAAGS